MKPLCFGGSGAYVCYGKLAGSILTGCSLVLDELPIISVEGERNEFFDSASYHAYSWNQKAPVDTCVTIFYSVHTCPVMETLFVHLGT